MHCPACGEYIQYPEQGYCEFCGVTVDDGRGRDQPAPDDSDR